MALILPAEEQSNVCNTHFTGEKAEVQIEASSSEAIAIEWQAQEFSQDQDCYGDTKQHAPEPRHQAWSLHMSYHPVDGAHKSYHPVDGAHNE